MLQVYEFDVAQYLTDPAAIEAYLQNALEGGDPAEIEEAQAVAVRARARLSGDSLLNSPSDSLASTADKGRIK